MHSWTKPTVEQVQNAIEKIRSHPAHWQSFFNKLRNPLWAKPLYELGVFDALLADSEVIHTYVDAEIRWAEGAYLVRVASKVPELVVAIARRLAECPKQNVAAMSLIVKAISNLNAPEIESVFQNLLDWAAKVRRINRMGICLTSIVLVLMRSGYCQRARQLARATWPLNRPAQPPKTQKEKMMLQRYGDHLLKKDLMRESEFQQCIRFYGTQMIEADPSTALDIFREMLIECVKLERQDMASNEPVDCSFVWRPAIEEHTQNSSFDWRNAIIVSARDAAVARCKSCGISSSVLEGVGTTLQQFASPIFLRIALHVYREFAQHFCDSATLPASVMTCENFTLPYAHHELYWLVQRALPKLDEAKRGQLFQEWCKANVKDGAKPIGWDNVADIELLRWFDDLAEYLPTPAQNELAILKEGGMKAPVPPDFEVYMNFAWVGRAAPFGKAQLIDMTVQELVETLSGWNPTNEPFGDTPIRLAEVLASVVEHRFLELLPQLLEFMSLDATYLVGVIQGIGNYTNNNNLDAEQWMSVLQFLQEVCEEMPARNTDVDTWIYHHPATVHHCIATLLRNLLGQESLEEHILPKIWETIEALLKHAEVNVQIEDTRDVYWLSVNSGLGVSQHCIVRYLSVAYRFAGEEGSSNSTIWDSIRASWKALQDQLNRVDGGEIMAGAVCGGHLATLYSLDKEWVVTNRLVIFSRSKNGSRLEPVAWSAFVRFNKPYRVFAPILILDYSHAFELYAEDQVTVQKAEWWDKYIYHLCALMVCGALEEAPGGIELWDKFSSKCDEPSLSTAIRCIGTEMSRQHPTEVEVPDFEAGLERAQNAWMKIRAQLEESEEGEPRRIAAAAFGWWVGIEGIDSGWFLANATGAIKVAGELDNLWTVFEWLAQCDQLDGEALFQFVDAVAQSRAIGDLCTMDVPNIIQVFGRIGAGRDEVKRMAIKKTIERFTPLDEGAFRELFDGLFG